MVDPLEPKDIKVQMYVVNIGDEINRFFNACSTMECLDIDYNEVIHLLYRTFNVFDNIDGELDELIRYYTGVFDKSKDFGKGDSDIFFDALLTLHQAMDAKLRVADIYDASGTLAYYLAELRSDNCLILAHKELTSVNSGMKTIYRDTDGVNPFVPTNESFRELLGPDNGYAEALPSYVTDS